MIDGLSEEDALGSRRVITHHATYVCAVGGGRIRRKMEVVRREGRVEFIAYETGLDAHPSFFLVELEDTVHVFGEVEHNGVADRLSGQACAAAPWKDAHAKFCRN